MSALSNCAVHVCDGLGVSMGLLAQAEAAQIQSIWDFMVKGGPIMVPIGVCSLVALAVIVERSISLRRRRVIPPTFMDELKQRLNGSSDREAALECCESSGSPLAEILAAGIRRLSEPVESLERHIESAGERVVFKLRKHMRALSVIGSICPLLGLLGTIFGMIDAFQTVAGSAEALGRTELLAGGIYEAMITTAAGLVVAIPVIIAYHWLSARIDHLVAEIDRIAIGFVEEFGLSAESRAREGLRLHTENGESGAAAPAAAAMR